MPMYCYRGEMNQVVEKFFRMGEAPQSFVENGQHFKRDFTAEAVGVPPRKGWPMECIASGVHASQAGELRNHLARAGVPTEVTPDGNPIYKNAGHRRRALKARGIVDKASYV